MSYIIVTGGAGYIGSHTVIELIQNNYKVIIVDNLCNSSFDSIARIEFIVGQHVPFYNVDLRDYSKLSQIFKDYDIQSVIHFAALKAVGESTKIPLTYYDNNINGTINLLKVMNEFNVKTIVFSSSATVYGDATRFENMIPIPEHCPNDPTNPYGKTKYTIEQIIHDLYTSDSEWKAAILRYFNPIGAHPSGLIGEDPLGIPNNLLPYLAQVAIGRREKLSIFGDDYDSHDGTPIRDYIHVVDLAKGHISALNYLNNLDSKGLFREWNLGTGKGSTVFDVYNAFCKAVGKQLPYEVVGRRDGDVLNLTADPKRANTELKWQAKLSIEDACNDLWKWTTENPFGFNIEGYKWETFGTTRLHHVDINGFKVSIMNHGATIQNIEINDDSLVLGFEKFEQYLSDSNPYYGATIGRYANRIGGSEYKFEGTNHKLDSNENNKNTLHGGFKGFDKQAWLGPIAQKSQDSIVLKFKLIDKDGSNGFPNDLETIITYTIGDKSLEIEYEAISNGPTPINLTNHSYFKLGGDVKIDLATTKNLKLDTNKLPTGEVSQIKSSNFKLGEVQFDDCFIVKQDGSLDTRLNELETVFTAKGTHSLKVQTTEPSFQFYTIGESFAVEPGRFINAINDLKQQQQVILRKNETYGAKIKYIFD